MDSRLLTIYAALVSTVAVGWLGYLQFGQGTLTLKRLTVRDLSAGEIVVERDGKEYVLLSKSKVTKGGAIAVLNADGEQALVLSDGAIAIRGGIPDASNTVPQNLKDWALVLSATKES